MVRDTSNILDSNFNICYVVVSFCLCRFVVFAIRFDRICELAEKRSQNLSKVLVKAMLTSPTQDANGYSNTFGVQDFASLRAYGSNRAAATEVVKLLTNADEFIAAYGTRISVADSAKAMSIFEIRCAMHVDGKKHEMRANFKSLTAIAADWYMEMKQLDDLLPKWSMLPEDALKYRGQTSSTDNKQLCFVKQAARSTRLCSPRKALSSVST